MLLRATLQFNFETESLPISMQMTKITMVLKHAKSEDDINSYSATDLKC